VSGPEHRKQSSWKKRNLKYVLIEPFKQIKLGIYVMALSVVFVCFASYLIYGALTAQYQQVMDIFQVVDASKQWELTTNDVFKSSALKIILLFSVYILALMGVVLRFTHKIYGPLVSIERYIDRVSAGHYRDRVKTRDHDDLQTLVGKLNVLAEQLETRHGGNERRSNNRREPDTTKGTKSPKKSHTDQAS
jgi:hypothetical protein